MNEYEKYEHSGTQTNAICRGCKQPYRDHINYEGDKVCPWPKEHPKPSASEDRDSSVRSEP